MDLRAHPAPALMLRRLCHQSGIPGAHPALYLHFRKHHVDFQMQLRFRTAELTLRHKWTIARGSATRDKSLFVELVDEDGVLGLGEAAPSSRYQESIESAEAFLQHVDAGQLSFKDLESSMAYLHRIAPGQHAAKGALNIALLDGAAQLAGQPIYDYLKLGFREGTHYTSFSIGIDSPDIIRAKVAAAEKYPLLKLKVGVPGDRENLQALREVAPKKRVRVDANEGWKTKEQALEMLEWLASDGHIEFVEQPMPASTNPQDLAWLKARSPLPLMADEAYISSADLKHCAEFYHAVNVKLVKAEGISGGYKALKAAREAGLKTMLGCMIESSILITAGAHLAELTDYLDLDGNLLISNDPYLGATAENGLFSFKLAPKKTGLRVDTRS